MQSTKHFLKEQFSKLTLKPNAPVDEFAIAAWRNMAATLVGTFGDDKFTAAVDKWLAFEQFFPSNPNDLRKYMPGVVRDTCPTCVNTEGWAYIADDRNGREKVIRCTHGRPE